MAMRDGRWVWFGAWFWCQLEISSSWLGRDRMGWALIGAILGVTCLLAPVLRARVHKGLRPWLGALCPLALLPATWVLGSMGLLDGGRTLSSVVACAMTLAAVTIPAVAFTVPSTRSLEEIPWWPLSIVAVLPWVLHEFLWVQFRVDHVSIASIVLLTTWNAFSARRDQRDETETQDSFLASVLSWGIGAALSAGLVASTFVLMQHLPYGPGSHATIGAIVALLGFVIGQRMRWPLAALPFALLGGLGLWFVPRLGVAFGGPEDRAQILESLGPLGQSEFARSAFIILLFCGWTLCTGVASVLAALGPERRRWTLACLGSGIGFGPALVWGASFSPWPLSAWMAGLAVALPVSCGLFIAIRKERAPLVRLLGASSLALIPIASENYEPVETGDLTRGERRRTHTEFVPQVTPSGLVAMERFVTVLGPMTSPRIDGVHVLPEPSMPETEALELDFLLGPCLEPIGSLMVDGYATDRHLSVRGSGPRTWTLLSDFHLCDGLGGFPWTRFPGHEVTADLMKEGPGSGRRLFWTAPGNPRHSDYERRVTAEALVWIRDQMKEGDLYAQVLDPGLYSPHALNIQIRTFVDVFSDSILLATPTSFETARLFLLSSTSPFEKWLQTFDREALQRNVLAMGESLRALVESVRGHRVVDPALRYALGSWRSPDPMRRLLRTMEPFLDKVHQLGPPSLGDDSEPRWNALLSLLEAQLVRGRTEPLKPFVIFGDDSRHPVTLEELQLLLRSIELDPGEPQRLRILERLLETLYTRAEYDLLVEALEQNAEGLYPWPGGEYLLGKAYLAVLEPAVAIEHLEVSHMLQPDYKDVDVLLGLALFEEGRPGAKDHLLAGVARDAVPKELLADAGRALVVLEEPLAAADLLRAHLDHAPEDEAVRRELADLERLLGDG